MKRVIQSYYSDKEVAGRVLKRFEILRNLSTRELETTFIFKELDGEMHSASLSLNDFTDMWEIDLSKLLDVA